MGKASFKGKGGAKGKSTMKPWVKQASFEQSKGSFKGKGKSSKGSFSKGKGTGKGKGKFKGAAPKNSQFWVRKMEEENREVLETDILTGTCSSYNWKQGWGFILPDSPKELPAQIKKKLGEFARKAKKDGKELTDTNLIYFRKPDVEPNFRIKEGSLVTFQVYVDDKGCGACEVCNAGEEEEQEN
eukprot:TRINITY_DN10035_c0_g2_i1.p1 TRINITY_DN10035_c0_g2~~TRINITY_DN10035_c0_g2_i1.p1  ORF type:complete len:185 (+),score=58.51 TRINITY_DN10035_c0_g2_i1:65-619(+)